MNLPIFEPLDARTLLAVSINMNFQPDGVTPPPGYRVDTGAAYGKRANGMTYGWNADNRANVRDRNAHADQRYDTLNHMQRGGSYKWEIAVPNGQYQVRVVAGDPSYFDSVFKTNVENKLALNFTPSSSKRFGEATVTVTVGDGRLTISNASGAKNNKISFVEIRSVDATTPQPPTATAQWKAGPNLPEALGEVAGGVISNKLYVIGDGSSKTMRYDLSAKTWSSSLAKRPYPAKDQTAEIVNGKLYVFGGIKYSGGQRHIYNYTQIYDPATNKWTQGARMPFAAGASQTAVVGGKIYLAGGITSGNVTTNRTARYDPATNKWAELAKMPGVGRNSAPTGTDGKLIWVFGGRVGGDRPENGRSDILFYDVAKNVWKSLGVNLPVGRGGTVKAPFINGEFYLIGGETTSSVIGRVDIFNPSNNKFRRGPDMRTPRHGIYPMFANNAIHVPGGGVVSGASNSRVFESLSL